jgi:hypothetical protein
VRGSLDLRGTATTVLPDNLKVGGTIYGLESDITPSKPGPAGENDV